MREAMIGIFAGVAITLAAFLVWVGLKEPEIARRACLKQPGKMWSQGVCYDR
jgi:hypothetical protein